MYRNSCLHIMQWRDRVELDASVFYTLKVKMRLSRLWLMLY